MASAFRGQRVESRTRPQHAAAVPAPWPHPFSRLLLAAFASVGASCHGSPAGQPETQRPDVAVVTRWLPGQPFRTALAERVPDEPTWRAALVWWRHALRQTTAFAFDEGTQRDVPELELDVDPTTGALWASLRTSSGKQLLAGERIGGGDLPGAIDRLAWATRLSLGEDAPTPVPIALGTSADPRVVCAVDDAETLLRDGGHGAAMQALRSARARDGAAPFVLDGTASLQLLRGDFATAERTAREALGYENRLLPTTRHRLARTLLLARASLDPEHTQALDQELLQLARVTARERPHDAEPMLTEGIARNFLADFAGAKQALLPLVERLPQHAIVAYHLGWALLGSGDPQNAAIAFERASVRLPSAWTVLPRAIALHTAGRAAELRTLLESLRDPHDDSAVQRQLLAMLAAEALLAGDEARARQFLHLDLDWLLRHPHQLAEHVGEFAERGTLLVRLGDHDSLPPLLAIAQTQHATTPIADAAAFLGGMLEVARTGAAPLGLEERLGHGGDSVFVALLQAYAHERRGEVADMQTQLARAARLSSSPLTKALLARGLAAGGRVDEATTLRTTLHTEMLQLHLRRPCQHPLSAPELAYAFLLR